MRLRSLLVSGSAALAAGALILAGQASVATTAAPASHAARQPSARFLTEARAALVSYLSTNHGFNDPKPGQANAPVNSSLTESYNWSGYADYSSTPGKFTAVSGQWHTPRVTCTREDQLTSDWVGLDGFNDGTVEQDGTISWCFEGRPTYFTWYEMYPSNTIEVGASLRPGDKITASVTRSGASYALALADATHHANGFSVSQTCATNVCEDTSAEWIAERPAFGIGIAPLADYGTWTLSHATQTAGGTTGTISGFSPSYQMTMIDGTGTYPLSTASALAGGNKFATRWRDSY